MRYAIPTLIILALIALVVINAGGGRKGAQVGWSIVVVIAGLVLMMVLFALFVTRPVL